MHQLAVTAQQRWMFAAMVSLLASCELPPFYGLDESDEPGASGYAGAPHPAVEAPRGPPRKTVPPRECEKLRPVNVRGTAEENGALCFGAVQGFPDVHCVTQRGGETRCESLYAGFRYHVRWRGRLGRAFNEVGNPLGGIEQSAADEFELTGPDLMHGGSCKVGHPGPGSSVTFCAFVD